MANPYELWQTHTLLASSRPKKPENWYFSQFYAPDNTLLIDDEWIDLEDLPLEGRELAPFVQPLGRGHSIYVDSATHSRFKPAYSIVQEDIGPLDGLSVTAGIDPSVIDSGRRLTILDRRRALKAKKAQAARKSVERTWEWLRAKSIIDGKVTIVYKDGTSVLVDFQRNSNHTETLTGANCWGQSGVSIMDHIQEICDSMNDADFGGLPTRMTMGGNVWSVLRKDAELKEHMDINIRGAAATIERGIVAGADGSKVYKVGELSIGGGSGATIEMWVNNETYSSGTRYLGAKEVVFTSTADAIRGFSCFGRIIDGDADYQAMPIFPKNFVSGDDVKTEHMSFKSAPLFPVLSPDATYKVTPLD